MPRLPSRASKRLFLFTETELFGSKKKPMRRAIMQRFSSPLPPHPSAASLIERCWAEREVSCDESTSKKRCRLFLSRCVDAAPFLPSGPRSLHGCSMRCR